MSETADPVAPRKRVGRGPSVVRRFVFSLVPLLVLLTIGEVLARVAWHPTTRRPTGIGMVPHPSRIWALAPGDTQVAFDATFSVGADGLRTVPPVPAARYRALTLGDSSIFGHGLPDEGTLHVRLARAFAAAGVPVEVLDGGIPGYSSEQSLALLHEVGWAKQPDLLIIGNLWSDNGIRFFSDREWMNRLRASDASLVRLLDRSQLLRWMGWQVAPPREESLPVGWVRDPYATGRRRVPVTDYAQNVDTMLMEAAERQVSVVMLSPCNRLLASPGWSQPTAWDVYFQTMRAVADRRSVPLVDACGVIGARGVDGDAVFLDEMHPTAMTNGLYADALVRVLTARGWPFRGVVPDAALPLWSEQIADDYDPALEGQGAAGAPPAAAR